MRTQVCAGLLALGLVVIGCTTAVEPESSAAVQVKDAPVVAAVETGQWAGSVTIPENSCGVPTDDVWFVVTQRNVSRVKNTTKVDWSTTGYGCDLTTGTYTLESPPPSNGRQYAITFSSSTTLNSIGWPIKSTKKYQVTLLPAGPMVTWTEFFDASKSPSTTTKVACR